MTNRLLNILILAFLGLMILFLLSARSGEARIITVDDDGPANHSKIQDAIDAAEEGDTIRVYEGMYYENVVVNKSVSVIGNGSANTTIDGRGDGEVVKITVDWCNVSGFNVTESGNLNAGIEVRSNSNTLSNNTCSNNYYGIYLWDSVNNTLTNNNCSNNNYHGIRLYLSSNCTLTNNTCSSNNYRGIYLDSSSDCTITNNTCSSNNHHGIYLYKSSDCTFTNNTCSSNNYYGIYLRYSSNNTLTNNTASNNYYGIY
ncbi:MAG: right-handed parallel beta-helix repeat-containing protein, partial [Thermoplasmata archaeon]|nr:right-handed parallel beta-helix repeat-containing protein [Thermoplasmata archaeon]